MKFDLVEPLDWEDPPQTVQDGDEQQLPAAGPVRAAAEHARDRFRTEAGNLQAALGRMWHVITSVQAGEPVAPTAGAAAPANFRPGAFSSRDA